LSTKLRRGSDSSGQDPDLELRSRLLHLESGRARLPLSVWGGAANIFWLQRSVLSAPDGWRWC